MVRVQRNLQGGKGVLFKRNAPLVLFVGKGSRRIVLSVLAIKIGRRGFKTETKIRRARELAECFIGGDAAGPLEGRGAPGEYGASFVDHLRVFLISRGAKVDALCTLRGNADVVAKRITCSVGGKGSVAVLVLIDERGHRNRPLAGIAFAVDVAR